SPRPRRLFEFCQGDYGGDPCYEAVFSDQGWDGLPLLSIYKVGLNDSETQHFLIIELGFVPQPNLQITFDRFFAHDCLG
ncbi:hypothetical protein, partial [Microcystis aeruginosa]|uniref:hypothetical protein n=1 Tax=Microcystis aeruginosa TaxID=1126 RepID=UPI001EE88E9C